MFPIATASTSRLAMFLALISQWHAERDWYYKITASLRYEGRGESLVRLSHVQGLGPNQLDWLVNKFCS